MTESQSHNMGGGDSAFSRPEMLVHGSGAYQDASPSPDRYPSHTEEGKTMALRFGERTEASPIRQESDSPAHKPSAGSPAGSPDEDLHKTAGDPDKPGLGRAYVPWNSEEEECLRLGVVKHGVGAWQIILRDPDFSLLKKRTGIQLKDKWRNLVKFNHLSREETVLAASTTKRKGAKRTLKGNEPASSTPPQKRNKSIVIEEPASKPPTGWAQPPSSMEIPREAMASLQSLRAHAQASDGRHYLYQPVATYHTNINREADTSPKAIGVFEGPSSRVMAADHLAANGLRTRPLDCGPQAKALNFTAVQSSRRRSWAGERMAEAQEMQRFEDLRAEQERQLLKGMQGSGYGAGSSHTSDEDRDERDWVKAPRRSSDRPPPMSAVHEWQQLAQWKEMQIAGLIELRMILAESLQIQSEADNSLLDTVSRCRDGTRSPQQLQEAIKICEIANDKVQLTYQLMDAWRQRICSEVASDTPRHRPFAPRRQ